MSVSLLLRKKVGDTAVCYLLDEENGCVELELLPDDAVGRSELRLEGRELSPLAELKLQSEAPSAGFGAGRSMRFGSSRRRFRYVAQNLGSREIETVLEDSCGCRVVHRLSWRGDVPAFRVAVTFQNRSQEPVTLEMLESFSIGGIGAELDDASYEELTLHRFRSRWASEGQHVAESVESLGLSRPYHGFPVMSERFGQVGTMPVRGFHPAAMVEDPVNRVVRGAFLAWTGSWQMELSHACDPGLTLSGGLADRELGHWRLTLAPGGELSAPEAIIGCVRGTVDDLSNLLLREVNASLNIPDCEQDLPVIFNEWCTSWGEPAESNLLAIADRLRDTPVRYLVIDAGWYKTDGTEWSNAQGDWRVNRRLFPEGIGATARKIRERGLIPGIWFEAEVCGFESEAFSREAAHHLHLDGQPIVAGGRHFWNLNDSAAMAYLDEKVVHMLKENSFGYVKIDYNATIGLGCDHPDSPGEGLRRQVEGTHRFFRRLREVNPDLVIENCASGGHRLEPAMFALTSMSSFSDAHEDPGIPLIAANLHRLMLPRQCQIWVVIRRDADLKRLGYLLSSGMLGRLCLSGDILNLEQEQWNLVLHGLEFYRKLVPVLRDGDSRLAPAAARGRTRLTGAQTLVRIGRDRRQFALFLHAFETPPAEVRFRLPEGEWTCVDEFSVSGTGSTAIEADEVVWCGPAPMSGRVMLFEKR